MSALLVGALLVQSITEELLPIAPLVRVAGLTYVLSLVWIVLWVAAVPAAAPRRAAARAATSLIIATLVYLTGGPSSPFAFLLPDHGRRSGR